MQLSFTFQPALWELLRFTGDKDPSFHKLINPRSREKPWEKVILASHTSPQLQDAKRTRLKNSHPREGYEIKTNKDTPNCSPVQTNPKREQSLPKHLSRGYALVHLFSEHEVTWAKETHEKNLNILHKSLLKKEEPFCHPLTTPAWSQGLQSPWSTQHWKTKGRKNVWTGDFWLALGICQFLPQPGRVCSSLKTLGIKDPIMPHKDFVSSEAPCYEDNFIIQQDETFQWISDATSHCKAPLHQTLCYDNG